MVEVTVAGDYIGQRKSKTRSMRVRNTLRKEIE